MINLKYYKANDGIYVYASQYNFSTNYKVNGKAPEKTHASSWYFLPKDQSIDAVEMFQTKSGGIIGFVLHDESMASEKIPLKLSIDEVAPDEDGDWLNHSHLRSLYKSEIGEKTESWITVEFTPEFVGEVDISNKNSPSSMRIEYKGKNNSKKETITLSERPHWSDLDLMLTPEFALHERPCSLDGNQMYSIIRSYIKEHINPKTAVIKSDYDFCFSVSKKAGKKLEHKSKEIKKANGRSYARPKFKTWTEDSETAGTIFEMTPPSRKYEKYTVIHGISGENYEDLVQSVHAYLEELIEMINRPLMKCECCGGYGYVDKGSAL